MTFQYLLLKLGRMYEDDECSIESCKRWSISALLEIRTSIPSFCMQLIIYQPFGSFLCPESLPEF